MSRKRLDYSILMPGVVVKQWTILKDASQGKPRKHFLCRCGCGTERVVDGKSLLYGKSKSCGCLTRVSKEERAEYKRNWFQKNKGAIMERRRANPTPKEATYRYGIKYRYGVTFDEYVAFYVMQRGRCFICEVPFDVSKTPTKPCVDHDHVTGYMRGILCKSCNTGLGMFKDNPELLKKAYLYLGGKS